MELFYVKKKNIGKACMYNFFMGGKIYIAHEEAQVK
jgi:hypothetical protein